MSTSSLSTLSFCLYSHQTGISLANTDFLLSGLALLCFPGSTRSKSLVAFWEVDYWCLGFLGWKLALYSLCWLSSCSYSSRIKAGSYSFEHMVPTGTYKMRLHFGSLHCPKLGLACTSLLAASVCVLCRCVPEAKSDSSVLSQSVGLLRMCWVMCFGSTAGKQGYICNSSQGALDPRAPLSHAETHCKAQTLDLSS